MIPLTQIVVYTWKSSLTKTKRSTKPEMENLFFFYIRLFSPCQLISYCAELARRPGSPKPWKMFIQGGNPKPQKMCIQDTWRTWNLGNHGEWRIPKTRYTGCVWRIELLCIQHSSSINGQYQHWSVSNVFRVSCLVCSPDCGFKVKTGKLDTFKVDSPPMLNIYFIATKYIHYHRTLKNIHFFLQMIFFLDYKLLPNKCTHFKLTNSVTIN